MSGQTRAEKRRELEVALLDACVVETRTRAELHAACVTETTETSDQVQAVRLRVYAATDARERAAETYVALLDGPR